MRHCPSLNFGPRRNSLTPILIVIHYTAMASAEAAIARLCDPQAEVSAHYLIDRSGPVTQMVNEEHRAWHAGVGEWRGLTDINSRSIGIELDNDGTHPFPEPQMAALEDLLRGIRSRWPVAASDIIGHSDMAPGRKSDPGPRFDWARLARQGLAAPVSPQMQGEGFEQSAQRAGFTAPVDRATLLTATRLRFAPWREGPITDDDLQLYHRI
ncbi:N-acetylmuramoyl-L-alanine amidase [Roseobacter denitrificans]|uniref:N-acetylmuramoyl-L-alanine amidase n=1 Tax=Roseobacter denitrificans TaxID=2434 RepID=UPI0002E84DFB|nr:N-acetylmuramoyl-L-alanine amidase [Roseobacter denitrificans]AVL54590.1 N-acetylmuramoyl-L-alanine amidase [Roseobacter denitrificans]SFF89398.1 N-acetylmuramoyl-L-alanine amidase [Roseobacter denitrificans OCh 114]